MIAAERECRRVVLGLGGNEGGIDAVVGRFREAVRLLCGLDGPLRQIEAAPLFRSRPISEVEQPDFVNTVVTGSLRPQWNIDAAAVRHVVGWCKFLERQAGRSGQGQKNGPRPLDLDLLVFGTGTYQLPPMDSYPPCGESLIAQQRPPEPLPWPGEIVVPHPRMTSRRFVLRPLVDLLPTLVIPKADRAIDHPGALCRAGTAASAEPGETAASHLQQLGEMAEDRVERLPIDGWLADLS